MKEFLIKFYQTDKKGNVSINHTTTIRGDEIWSKIEELVREGESFDVSECRTILDLSYDYKRKP